MSVLLMCHSRRYVAYRAHAVEHYNIVFYSKHLMSAKILFSRTSNVCDFCDLSRIVKLNTRVFMEFAHYHNFIYIEYQHLENTRN